ncbi:M23 family metallopeptidase [Blastococcus sp. VKM Ac-2987]|uniref:M23 family metallopeptidase n=1 Tax=Blastococcus sp. VKM Ac-2987 TaxID=3004141 RepID=UPI0022AB8E1E|nr:M23 family metallopeptidase [Blastococcus sp. VKM Ac-2987]MCZ2857697.1 M23 family metallopeptidase [Blastococcus sp. VKM Ac-2987]
MSSLHHDRLLEGGAVPARTATTAPAPSRSTQGDVEGKAASTVPPQRQGKAQSAGVRRATDPTTRPAPARADGAPVARARATRTATAKAAGTKAVTATAATAKAATAKAATARAATRRAATAARTAAGKPATAARPPRARSGGRPSAATPAAAALPTARAAVVRAIAAKVAADAAAARRRPTPYKRSAVDLAALAPVTDVTALVEAPSAGPEAVVVVKGVPAAPAPAVVVVEPLVDAAPAGAVAVAGGRRGLLARRLPTERRRSALYLAAVLVGALGVSGASVSEPLAVETRTVSHSISVAEQLGIEATAAPEGVDEEDTSRLREMVVSRNVRDAERTAAADAQAEADRLAAEEAARVAAEAARPKAVLPVAGARLTSGFGARWGTLHAGIDLAAPMRTPEYAAMDGVVLEAGAASGYGLVVYIQHDNGDVTVYGHMDEILVEPGQVVRAGDTIALLGNRGQSTGPHLHFEVHVGGIDGQRIDPLPWLRERGVDI